MLERRIWVYAVGLAGQEAEDYSKREDDEKQAVESTRFSYCPGIIEIG
jgi:hypothetical protein